MKNILFLVFLLCGTWGWADTKISQLPLGSAASTGTNDSFPFVNAGATETMRLTLWDLPNLPPFQDEFLLLVPSQTGNTGKFLTTNGSVTSWTNAGAGSVTSVGLAVPAYLSVSGSPVTGSGTLTIGGSSQAANSVLASPNGTTGVLSVRTLVGADLPNPGSATKGGVFSKAVVSHDFLTGISSADGSVSQAQPAFTDISGVATGAQLPNPSSITLGGVESYAAVTNQWINTISTSGVPSSSQPSFSNISGSVGAGQLPLPGATTLGGVFSEAVVSHNFLTGISSIDGSVSQAQPAFSDLTGSATGAQLPNPSASTLGGIESYVAVSHQWINTISTSGVPASSQPAFSDISGSATGAQLPLPAVATLGGVFSKAVVSHDFLTGISSADGSVSQAQPAFTDISGTASAAQLPNPSATTLGGIESYAAVTNQWINTISTSGVPSSSQPAFTNISGSVASTQMPALTGDVTTSAGAVATTVAKIQSVTVSGTTGTGNVVFSASPTLTGTAVLASATVSGSLKSGNCHLEPSETDIGNSGSAQSIDLSTANVFTSTLNANTTFTFSNPVAGCPYVFILTQDASTGSHTLTTAGVTVIWGNTGTKTLSTPVNSVDKITCVYNGNISKLLCDLGVAYQ